MNQSVLAQNSLPSLVPGLLPSPVMPVIFVGHGSPMNAIEKNIYNQTWQRIGAYFEDAYEHTQVPRRWPKPQLILSVSAHWLTRGWGLTAMQNPPTIHDFGGFPTELHQQQYPAPGAPQIAKHIAHLIQQPGLGAEHEEEGNKADDPEKQRTNHARSSDLFLDTQQWGFDHGTWSVLKPMFPKADIAVIQLSIDYHASMSTHFDMGVQLRQLRSLGVLIIGSGNTVHNLGAMDRFADESQAYDWNKAFDDWVAACIDSKDLRRLETFQNLGALAKLAHPSYEHFLPILYTAGAACPEDRVEYFNDTYQAKSVAMRSVIWY